MALSTDQPLTIRAMAAHEVELMGQWAAAEGWNPGLSDGASFYATDPGGFFLGLIHGRPCAMISAVRYGSAFGFLGFYIVEPSMRGRGYGLALWRTAMEYLGARNVGLDGVVAQQANYERSGFVLAHHNIRFEGRIVTGSGKPPSTCLIELSALPFEELLSYDAQLFGTARPRFLRNWISQPGALAIGAIENSGLIGYGVRRPCHEGFKIGPLFADRVQVAQELFGRLSAGEQLGAPLFLDVPAPNAAARALAEGQAMRPVFQTARMYNRRDPRLPLERIFGITSFELG
ncbi:MAG TPA: GNAT family N-acetyltransferase [Candidatus Binataceae bacterium]|nr:GNAT family N-acetyltransferase [Candidatus Binataceae bacterium]